MTELKRHTGAVRLLRAPCRIMVLSAMLIAAGGCQKAPPPQPQAGPPPATETAPPTANNDAFTATTGQAPATTTAPSPPPMAVDQPAPPPPAPAPVVVPAGTRISVRLDTTLASNTSQVGEQFSATVAKTIRVKGAAVIPAQSTVVGKVIDAKAAGKFSGASSLGLQLQSVADHQVTATAYSQHVAGKGGRSAAVIGGTALAGALLGGLAGHGRGALIGGAVGGGVGTLGAAETGNNRDVVLPAGSVLTFNLTRALTLDAPSSR